MVRSLDVLLVDDEPSVRAHVGDALRAAGHRVVVAADGAQALAHLEGHAFDVVVADVRLPRVDGFAILRRVRADWPRTEVLLITAYGNVSDAVAAIREKAVDYLTKPFEPQALVLAVERIAERRQLQDELDRARAQLAATGLGTQLIGRSPTMLRLLEQIDAIAESDASVLLTGESGTGKDVVARTIHARSARRDKPFVPVHCAAIPQTLIEAELFGHERGAFTGAVRSRDGRFKAADGGTLFLDEVGEMPPETQTKLLRVLQEGIFEPVGTNTSLEVDVRVISATNRDLKQRIARGRFREDLYYRVRVVELVVPPLRERLADLPLLVEHFLSHHGRADREPPRLSPAAWAALRRYTFPGNVRELRHAIEHAVVLCRGAEIGVEHLPPDIRGDGVTVEAAPASVRPLALALAEFEREYILRTLEQMGGGRKRAAQTLGISRKSLWQKLRKYGVAGAVREEARSLRTTPPVVEDS